MKFIIVLVALFAVALARPNQHVENLRQESDVHPLGFKFDVENSDGSKHSAEGVLKHLDTEHEALVVHGVFSYVGDDGHTYVVKYVADENGFQPEGAHLPVSPEHLH